MICKMVTVSKIGMRDVAGSLSIAFWSFVGCFGCFCFECLKSEALFLVWASLRCLDLNMSVGDAASHIPARIT